MHRDVINLYAPSLYRLHRKDNHRADLNLFGQKRQNPSWLGALQSSEWLVLEYNAYWDTAASPQFVLQRTLVRNREDQRYLWRQRVLCRPGQFTVHRLAEVDGSLPYLWRQVLCCVRDGRRRRKIEHARLWLSASAWGVLSVILQTLLTVKPQSPTIATYVQRISAGTVINS